MFKGYTLDEQAARERYLLLLREAEIERVLTALRANGEQKAGLRRLADGLGDFFIALGCKLKGLELTNLVSFNATINSPSEEATHESTS